MVSQGNAGPTHAGMTNTDPAALPDPDRSEQIDPNDLGAILRTLGEDHCTGTLSVTDGRRQSRTLYFKDGVLEVVRSPRTGTRLGRILLRLGTFGTDQLREVVAYQQTLEPRPLLGEVLRERGLCDSEDIREALTIQAVEDVLAMLRWPRASGSFHAGAPLPGLVVNQDVSLSLDPAQLAAEFERRRQEWSQGTDDTSTRDVYRLAAPPSTHENAGAIERSLIEFIDGQRDLGEVVEASGLPEIQVIQGLDRLRQDHHILALSAAELMNLSDDLANRKDHGRSLKRLLRAVELSGPDLEVTKRLAQTHLALGESDRAVACLLDFADEAGHDQALAALSQARDLAPERVDLVDRMAAQMIRAGRSEEGGQLLCRHARDLLQSGAADPDDPLRLLRRSLVIHADGWDARRDLAELYLSRGEPHLATCELDELAGRQLKDRSPEAAIETLQRRISIESTPRSLAALAEAFNSSGLDSDARNTWKNLVSTLDGVHDETSDSIGLRIDALEQSLSADESGSGQQTQLEQAYAQRDKVARSLDQLEAQWRQQTAENDDAALVGTLESLRGLAPERQDVAVELSGLLAQQDQRDDAVKVLRDCADIASDRGDHREAAELLARALTLVPLDLDLRQVLSNELSHAGQHQRSGHESARIGEVCLAVGHFERASTAFRRALEPAPEDAELRLRLAMALDGEEKPKEAAREYIRAAKFAAYDDENYGVARCALSQARELDPDNGAALHTLEALERRLSQATPAPGLEDAANTRTARSAMLVQPMEELGSSLDRPVLGLVENGKALPLVSPEVRAGPDIRGILAKLRGMRSPE